MSSRRCPIPVPDELMVEVRAVPVSVLVLLAAVLVVAGLLCLAVVRRLRRAVAAERAARRLTDAAHHRDARAYKRRIQVLSAGRGDFDALLEADAVLDEALAAHRTDPEGGTR